MSPNFQHCFTHQHRENQRHNVDGPCRAEAGEHGETEVVPQRGNPTSLPEFQVVSAPVQRGLGVHDRLPFPTPQDRKSRAARHRDETLGERGGGDQGRGGSGAVMMEERDQPAERQEKDRKDFLFLQQYVY